MMDGFRRASDGVWEIDADPDSTDVYALQWYDVLRGADRYWTPRAMFVPGETVTPPRSALNGHRYRCTVGGRTGTTQPAWPTIGAGTVVDGGVTWSRIDTEDRIAASAFTAEPGIDSSDASVDATRCVALVTLSGGVAGKRYLVTNEITTDAGRVLNRSFRVVVREQ